MRSVARRFRLALSTVQFWCRRATGRRLDRVDWNNRPGGCDRAANRTSADLESRVLAIRRHLREESVLGEYGARAIHREMVRQQSWQVTSIRTIGRILERRGALDGRSRIRHPAPPRGWYLPELAQSRTELDSFDVVEGLSIQGHGAIDVLNAISLHGGLPGSWARDSITAAITAEALLGHWREVGLPSYAQFDNDTRFQGPRMYPDSFGRVIRLCLSLDVTPVFVPPCETGFQAAIEAFNGRWQEKVWRRFRHPSLSALQQRSDLFIAAARQRLAPRLEAAPARRPFPNTWKLDWQIPLRGKMIFLRRTNDRGSVNFLVRNYPTDSHWLHRLVRVEVDFDAQHVNFYALRRRSPEQQPLLRSVPYSPTKKHFRE